MHEDLAQHRGAVRGADNLRVRRLIRRNHKTIAGRVHRKHRDAQVSVEADEPVQVLRGPVVRLDGGGRVQGAQIRRQVEAGGRVQRPHVSTIRRVRQQRSVFDSGSRMWITCSADRGAMSVLNAYAESSSAFHVAMPPESTPHSGIAAAKRFGYSWIRPAVTIPPSDAPQATTRCGLATCAAKKSRSAIWSLKASSRAQPVELYAEPAIA